MMVRTIVMLGLVALPFLCGAQGAGQRGAGPGQGAIDTAKWAKARDYLNCKLSLEAIKSKAKGDTAVARKLGRVASVLDGVSIDAPPAYGVLSDELKGFDRVKQLVSEPISKIDLHSMESAGVKRFVDSLFTIVGRGYVIDEGVKGQLRATAGSFLTPTVDSGKKGQAVAKPVIALGGQPNGVPATSTSRGFDFWVLLPVLLVVVVFVVMWQKLASVTESLRATKVQLRSFNENYFSGAGKGMDRKEIEKLIANSNALAELSAAVSKLQYQVSQLEGRSGAGRPGDSRPGDVRPSSDAGKGSVGRPSESGRPSDGGKGLAPVRQVADGKARQDGLVEADVFYMAGPVNNYFPNNAKSLTKDNTVYRFKVNANKQEAEFELHTSGAPIMEIVQLAESYIKTACDEENLPPYTVKNIVTKRAGKAILEGDKWVIKSKALIRYE